MKKFVLACVLCLCSLSAAAMQLVESRIIGGENVLTPPAYMVHLRVELPGRNQLCGGSYIGDGRVLTAAHCLFEEGSGKATTNVQMYFNIPSGDLRNIAEADRVDSSFFEIHPGYNNNRFFLRDAAVIFLPGEVPNGVSAVVLAEKSITDHAMANQRVATAYGWGLTEPAPPLDELDAREISDQLQAVDLNVDRENICDRYDDPDLCSEFILYAGSQNDGEDACQGDSGGPLVLNNSTLPVLLGLTSFGAAGCATDGEPGGYTRVSAIREWALDIESGRQVVETAVIAKRTTTGEGSISLGFIALLSLIFAYHRRRKQLLVESSC